MKKILSVMGLVALFATMTLCFNSCSSSDEPSDQLKVVNNTGSLTLRAFTFKIYSGSGEQLRSQDVGVLSPGDSRTMEIPAGAEKWRVGAYIDDDYEFSISPEYSISTKTLKLSYGDVHDGWTLNNDRF